MSTHRMPALDEYEFQQPVTDKDILTPPGSPATGVRYLINGTGAGGWLGHDNVITYYDGAAWQYVANREGMRLWVKDENRDYFFDGSVWVAGWSPIGGQIKIIPFSATANVISTAIAAAADGDVFVLGAGTYVQTEVITIPNTVTRYAIMGQGSGLTFIKYTANVGALTQSLTDTAYRMKQVKILGVTLEYDYDGAGSYSGLIIWGDSQDNLNSPSVIIDDVEMRYKTYAYSWAKSLNLIDCHNVMIDRFRSRYSPATRGGTAIYLQSCMNVRISKSYLMSCTTGVDCEKAADEYLLAGEREDHGCEDVVMTDSTMYIVGTGVHFGEDAFANDFRGVEFAQVLTEAVTEDSDADGYNLFDNIYLDLATAFSGNCAFRFYKPGNAVRNSLLNTHNEDCDVIRFEDGADRGEASHNIIRGCGASGSYGIFLGADKLSALGNRFEATDASGVDIYINSTADGSMVYMNRYVQAISDNGTNTHSSVNWS